MPFHYPIHFPIYSTGVLTREPATISVVVNIVNLDAYYEQPINIEVLDWSNYSNPVKLPILLVAGTEANFPYPLGANHLVVFSADLNESVTFYEIRISYRKHANIVANCFGRSAPPYTSQEGNTVYHKQLVKINENITHPYYHSS
ncbi:hypothetical protein BCJMU51_5441 [Bacillus cereus]|uniref:hypothetical protein n=1 Tax=Bacillus TaxID=1386 RepID=UPI0007A035FC|nr:MULTISPECIES: hypothetical protein [Bacillus]KYZ66385.1 hypothetical protein A3782_23450 [Bacillus sp. GZT]MCU5325525.1 hypothetical protein [Bacillus cereus]MCU5713982.1 hypothetical protein [Bacillus cereus]MDA1842470.1 hypothetical protein [Bacillus cereus]BCB40523.1 hypothetical protein BCM0045_5418 [Bacillus cereus]